MNRFIISDERGFLTSIEATRDLHRWCIAHGTTWFRVVDCLLHLSYTWNGSMLEEE